MSRIDTNFVKQLYSQAGVELTPEKLDHISNNYSSNEELQSAFELKYGSMNASTPEKKNSDVTSVSTSEAPQSESQQPQKKASSLSVGGKPIRTGDLESSVGDDKVIYINKDPKRGKVDDMSTPPPAGYRYQVVQNPVQLKKWKEQKSKINNESPFGPPIQTFQEQKSQEFKEVKKKEESKKKEALKSMPILGKDVKLNVPKADTKTTDLSGVKKVDIKPLTKTEQVSKNQVVNVAYDYAVNNLDTSLSEKKYQDEVNEKQFTDGIKQGLIDIYNDVIGNPLSSVTNLDLVVKKSKPLEAQYKEIEKIEAKEGVSYSPEVKQKMAKDMFIEEENKKQMYTLIDKALPSGYDREGIWKELKLQSIKSNDELRSTIASAEVFKGKINQFNDFFKENYKDLDEIEGGNEDKGNKYVFEIGGKKITLSESKYQEYEKLRQEAIDAKSKLESMSLDIDKIYNKASKDDELLDLFKYNYNDFQATKDRVLGGVGEIIGGGLKLLGEGSNYIEDKIGFAPGLALIPNVSDKAVEAGNALLDISQEEKEKYLRYNASDLTWDNLPSFGLQLFSEQLPVFLSIGLAGPGGLAAVSAGSGGRQFRDLEIEEQNNPFVRYSKGQKLTSAFLYGGAEYAGEFFGTRVLLKGFGNTIRNASLQNRRLFYDGMIKSTIKSLPKVATWAGVEGGSELATATMQIGVDLGVLGKEVKSKEAFERLYEATAAGVGMGGGISVVANNMQLIASQSKVFSTRQDMRKVGNLLNEIDVLNQELNNNPLLSEEDKAIIYKDMNAKTNEAFNIVSKNSAREKDFTIQEKAELLNINARQIELKEDYDKITDSNISEKIKKQKIDELNNKFNALEAKRNDILNKTYNEFNYLPESEKISLKNKAAEAIIQEQLDKGVKRDNIQEPNPEVINKKAIEIYESNKQTTGQVSEQEKPATTTEAKTTDATQQETKLQSQEEVNKELKNVIVNSNKEYDEIIRKLIKDFGNALNKRNKLEVGSKEYIDAQKQVEIANDNLNIFKDNNKDLILQHGTPYDFSKFELEKIGTGEGNQAFGYGLYFTEDSEIAKSYADKLSKDKDGLIYTVKIKNGRTNNWIEWRDALDDTQAENISKNIKSKSKEYKDYLDSVSDEKSHTGASEILFNDNIQVDERPLQGGAVYLDLKDAFGQQEATRIMQKSGIDGVKYRTKGGKGDSFNYVVFDPNSIVIQNKTTNKTETDAVQKQITDESVLQSEQSKMGLQEVEQGDTKQEVVAKQGEEIFSEIEGKDLSDKTTYDKVYDFLTKIENDLTDIQDNTLTAQGLPISVVKTAIKAMKAAMVAGKMASEVISAGIDALKNTDWYNKKTDVEKANLEPSLANLVIESSVRDEGKSMAKAEDKKQMALTEKIAERAKRNILKARLGKLSKNGIFRGKVSKVLSLSSIRPKDAKKILPKDLYDKYVGSIIKLAERGLTIKDTNIPNYEAVYDEIIPYFEEFEGKKATIQEKIYNGEDLTVEEQAFFDKNKKEFFESESKRDESKNEEKEKEIAKNKQELKDLRSKLRDAFKKSNLEKGSKTFEYIDVASMLTDEQIDSMSNAMLKNAIKAFNSFINDGVAPGYFSQIYSNTRTSNVESGISEIDKTAEKTGIYKYKIPKFVADVAQSVESFIVNLASFRVKRLDAKEKMIARIEKYRGTQIDAALKIYRGTPIYDNVIAPIAKKLSFFSSDVEKSLEEMNFVYKSFLKSLKASDDIFTSILRIRYAQLYVMQQSNKGTKSDVPAIEYFKATLKADVYSESENKKISDFIDYLESKGENYDIRGELTKAEGNALNGIRSLLDSNTESAYEERVFGNSNASPMIVDYAPVNGKDQMSDTDINDLVKRFEKGSFVSGNLKEKTGTAHPIDLHPFSSAMSSIMSTKLQYHLRTEVLAIKRGINNALNEAKESGNKQKVKLLSAVSEAIDSYVNAIVVGNKIKATAMDKTIDNIATIVSTALLSSETRSAAEFITNTPVLLADGLPMLLEGRKLVSDINELSNGNPDALREFLKTIEASQITSLMDKMKSASEKAGYTKKGVFANVMSNEIPTSAVKEKAKRFATDNKVSTSFGIYRNFLISGSDNMSRFTYFFGKFADEFKKEYGSPIEVDKVLDKNSDYLKDEKVLAAIKKASETTNKETTELFGSNNPIERALVSLEASKGIKGKNPITKMLDYAGNYMNQFNRGTISAMRTNINVAIEEKNGRELRKFLLQALRTMGYAPATVAISGLIGYAFYSDDDDEEQLKESLGKLREDEDLIKEVNGYFDFVKNKQEGDKYTEEEEKYRKDLMEKLMKNPEFKKTYDANYSFFNNKLLTQRISAITEKMNEGKSNFGLDSFERMMKIIDGDKETYGGSVEDFVKSMAYLNSERGMSYYPKEKRLELMEKIEDYFAENNFFDKKSVRKREGALDILAGYDLLEKLYNYREKGLDDRFLEEGVKMGLNYAIGAKGNLVRSSYETGAEYINRKMIEKKFDHYDYKKDKMFDRPITKFGLDDKAELSDIPKDLGRAITPAYIQYPTSMKESDIAIAKTLGLPFASSLNRAYNQKQKDEIYKETRGKFQENMLENINETALSAEAIRYILDKLEISMTEEEKEEVINIALTPGKGGDKGKTENKGRSSNRLKVGNKKLRGE